MLAAREVVERRGVVERTRIQRLVHTQLFGLEQAFQPDGDRTLLERASEDHAAEDRYYEFAQRAPKVNLVIENVGSAPFEDGTIVLDFPRMDGIVVVDQLCPLPGGKAPGHNRYPAVDAGSRTVRVQAKLGASPPGSKGMAFLEPLRVCVREQAAGKVVPISYTLYGRSLRASMSGALRIQVEDLARPQAAVAINEQVAAAPTSGYRSRARVNRPLRARVTIAKRRSTMRVNRIVWLVGILAIAGCARYSASSQVYPRYETRTAYDVEFGEVLGVREVEIEGYSTVVGRWGGAVVGDAIGSTVNGHSTRRVARAVGGVTGAIVGEAIERELTAEIGLEITVQLANGDTIAVVQARDIVFAPGDRVRVLFGPEGSARVTPP